MLNSLSSQLQRVGLRLQSFEQSLFRKEVVLPFLLGRLTLIAAMLLGFYLVFAATD